MKPLKLLKLLAGCVALAVMANDCAPSVTVENKTTVAVRAVVRSGKIRQVLSPSPGFSSSAEAAQGPYTVTVIPDKEWLDHAKATRKFLNDSVANPDMTSEQIIEVIRRLKDIAAKMQAWEAAATTLSGQSCSGAIGDSGGATVTVGTAADGTFKLSCSGPSGP